MAEQKTAERESKHGAQSKESGNKSSDSESSGKTRNPKETTTKEGMPPGTKLVERDYGDRTIGQQVPDGDAPVNKAAQDAAEAYHKTRSECPACHVHDGVREGTSHCNSCGASWPSE